MNPLFSVVIPLYNKELVVKRAIDSVLNQTEENFEIIIVNDGSTDKSQDEVEKINSKRINLIVQENQGASAARNKGIDHSKGKYVAFLDGDDVWKPNHLQLQKKLIEKFPDCGLYATAHEIHLKNGKTKCLEFGVKNGFEGIIDRFFKHSVYYRMPVCASSVVVPKYVFCRVGNFDTDYIAAEDLDMWYRIALKYEVAFSNNVTAIYKQDNDQVERLSIFKNKLNRPKVNETYIQRLARKKTEYFLKDYIKDVDLYITNHLLSSSLNKFLKNSSNVEKFRQFKERVKYVKRLEIKNIHILQIILIKICLKILRKLKYK